MGERKNVQDVEHWVSEKFVQLVDIVFGVVIAQGFSRYDDLIIRPWESWFAFLALVGVYIVTVLSWIGYHRSMARYRYRVNSIRAWCRMGSDLLIVALYARLLFSVDELMGGAQEARMSSYVSGYLLVFLLYLVSGWLRILETGDRNASRWQLILIFAVLYSIPLLTTGCWETLVCAKWLVNVGCWLAYIGYRVLRQRYYKKKMRIIVDVDGVLADQVSPVLERLNERYGLSVTKEEIRRWDEPIADTDIKTEIEKSHLDPDFVRSMRPLEDACAAMKELARRYEVIIATNRAPSADAATRQWLASNGIPYAEYINTSKSGKERVSGDVLIDDYPGNVLRFAASGGVGILFEQPWNENDPSIRQAIEHGNLAGRIIRARGWRSVVEILKSLESSDSV